MENRTDRNLSLFGDDVWGNTDELLQLNKTQLLGVLNNLKSVTSIPQLRTAIINLKRQIHDPRSELRSSTDDLNTVEFANEHLNQELDQISASQALERALYYVERLVKGISEVRESEVNDINLNRWKEYSDIYVDSLWNIDRRERSGVHTAGYWGNFIPQIPNQLMRRYTKKGDWVLDTFAGSGTTLIEGQRLGRNTIGIELQEEIAQKARLLINLEPNIHDVVTSITTGDSTTIDYKSMLQSYGRKSVQLIIMHPPYFDIIKFSDNPNDLSNASSVEHFLEMMGRVVDNALPILEEGRYLVVVIGDKYAKGEWIPLGFLTMTEVIKRGFILKSIVVKNFEETTGKRQQKELWRYRALVGGFYIFKHEYIFIFRKRKPKDDTSTPL